jgi:YD repeat-containing protein
VSLSKILCVFAIAAISSASWAQDVTDVEAKPYGSYTGSAIDTVDLVSGNLMLHIPLVSYPQKGTLPPLSFSVELNNAPYAYTAGADWGMSVRYDTAPPGAVFPAPPTEVAISGFGKGFQFQNVGAYMTSSFAGGIVTGQNQILSSGDSDNSYAYSLVDPDGTTHELESDASSPNTYRTPDGSGYAFQPDDSSSADFAFDWNSSDNRGEGADGSSPSANYWVPLVLDPFAPNSIVNGIRHGTIFTPTGVKYSSVFRPFPILSSDQYAGMPTSCTGLTTTATDPTGNAITRSLWNWSGCTSNSPFTDISAAYDSDVNAGIAHPSGYPAGPYYIDSVGRVIPDILTMQAKLDSPSNISWNVPGPGGNTLAYTLQYVAIANKDYTGSGQLQQWNGQPDPSVSISGNGFASGLALASITLPGYTFVANPEQGVGQPRAGQWQFIYSPQTLGQTVAGDPGFYYTDADLDGARTGPDLLQVITPTGGEIDYTYTTIIDTSVATSGISPTRCSGNCHAVSSRTVKDNNTTNGHSYTTTYTYGTYAPTSQISGCPKIDSVALYAVWTKETVSQANNTIHNDTIHSFCALDNNFANVTEGRYREIETQYFQGTASLDSGSGVFVAGANSTLLKTVTTPSASWQIQADILPPLGGAPTINALPTQVVTTTPRGSTTEVKSYSTLFNAGRAYCTDPCSASVSPYWTEVSVTDPVFSIPISYQSPTSDTIYSGTTATGNSLRKSTTTFEFQNPQSSSYLAANLVALPQMEQSLDSSNNPLSTTTYSYDDDDSHQLDGESYCGPSTLLPCGDLTKTTRWLNTGGNVVTNASYAQGMPTLKTDANGNQTSISYQCQGMYPLSITKAYGSSAPLPQTTSYTYDCATNLANSSGVVTGVTDPNGINTQYLYSNADGTPDSLGRLKQVQYGVVSVSGSSTAQSTTTLSYPSLNEVDISQQQSSSAFLNSSTVYDGLGRTIHQTNPAGYIVDTTYSDDSSRPYTVTNPSPENGSTPLTDGTTTYLYDALGRTVQKANPDSTTQQWCYDSTPDLSVWPSGNSLCTPTGTGTSWVNSMDELGITHIHQQNYDGIGQLIGVTEPNPLNGSMTTGALNTAYSYDGLGNLTTVTQSGISGESARVRTFTYDSLSRLICAANPESSTASCPTTATGTYTAGTTGYIYDANGNLSSKTDARGITVSYAYDGLNRLLSKTYSPTSTTPASCYQYDQAPSSLGSVTITNPIGRLTAEWTQKGGCPSAAQFPPQLPASGTLTSRILLGYDFMGRLTSEKQCTFSTCATPYNLAYSYDLAGHVTQASNGLGTISWQSQFDAAGRLSSVTANAAWIDPQFPSTLFNSLSYGPAGITSWQNSWGTFDKNYDNRLRVTDQEPQ